jgi:hypothetical protein
MEGPFLNSYALEILASGQLPANQAGVDGLDDGLYGMGAWCPFVEVLASLETSGKALYQV